MHPKYWKRKALNHVLREIAGEGSAGGGALDMGAAAAAFPMGDAPAEETRQEEAAETPEAAAEQIAQEEARAEAEKEGEQEEAAEPQKIVIKVDGKDVELSPDEVAEHYKNGLRQKDYTQKTMAAAEETKAAAAEKQEAKAKRDEYAQKLSHFAIRESGNVQELQARLTEELLDSDPVEYLRLERTVQARQAQLTQAQQELQQIGQQQQQEQDQARQSYQQQQLEALQAKLPEWKDPAKAKAEASAIKEYLGAQEFAPEDIAQMSDHKLVILAKKAMQFDALQAKAREAVKQVQKAPAKVEKPGNGVAPTDGRTRAMKALDSSGGSLRDAANVFAQFLT